jgi:hypothetical protein
VLALPAIGDTLVPDATAASDREPLPHEKEQGDVSWKHLNVPSSSNRLHTQERVARSTRRGRGLLTLALFAVPGWLALAPAPAFAALDGAECWADGLCQINGCQTPDPDCGDPPDLPRDIPLSISRYTTSTLDNATADLILAEATDVLQTNNGGVGDVACDVTFTRAGGVTTFSTGDGSIDSQGEFNAILAVPGKVKVVNQINWCGGIAFNTIVGCAPNPGSSQVVVRWTTIHLEGIIWAHEYGHTQGLPDRTTANYVMSGSVTPKSTRVNATECDAYVN